MPRTTTRHAAPAPAPAPSPSNHATQDGKPRVISDMGEFTDSVYDLVKTVPAGHVTTYGDVAEALGSKAVARHVGWALGKCWDADVPWWRVINSAGCVSFRAPDIASKKSKSKKPSSKKRKRDDDKDEVETVSQQEALLAAEGVTFETQGNMQKRRVRDFDDLRYQFPDVEFDEQL